MTIGTNPKDPLLKSGPDQQREVFNKFVQLAHGFSVEEVVGAAMNLIVNAVRQAHPMRRTALDSLDQTTTRTRELLASHYDASGKRRNVFPFHQTIHVPHIVDRDQF